MTPADLGAAVVAAVGDSASSELSFGQLTVDVPAHRWVTAAELVRDDPRFDCRFFDWLSAYDDGESGFAIVVNVWSVQHRHAVRLRTWVPREAARLHTLTGVWAGADWHERETFEMFGVDFVDHPNLVPLLLPDGFEGTPLRKDFVLASRVAKAWPGQKEPGESDRDLVEPAGEAQQPAAGGEVTPVRRRRRILPPGVPEPGEWGPAAGEAQP